MKNVELGELSILRILMGDCSDFMGVKFTFAFFFSTNTTIPTHHFEEIVYISKNFQGTSSYCNMCGLVSWTFCAINKPSYGHNHTRIHTHIHTENAHALVVTLVLFGGATIIIPLRRFAASRVVRFQVHPSFASTPRCLQIHPSLPRFP